MNKIITDQTNSILTGVAEPVDLSHWSEVDAMIQALDEVANANRYCAGLAAPQIGIPVRMFLVKIDGFNEIFINPEIIRTSGALKAENEGCLSVPGKQYKVRRKNNVCIKWINRRGIVCQRNFQKFASRCIQHEYDHLDGKLIGTGV